MNKTTTYFIEDAESDRINFEIDDEGIVMMAGKPLEFTDVKDLISQLRWVADQLERGVV